MNDTTEGKQPLSQRIGDFLHRYRTVLLVGSVVLLGGIIVAVAVYQFLDNRAERAARAVELVQERFDDYEALSDEEKAASSVPDEIRADIADIRDRYGRSYGDLRARWILASLEWELENYGEAEELYVSIVEDFPRSHLVGVSLAAAAAAAETRGDTDAAEEFLLRLADGEGLPNSEQSRALFNLGRLAESTEDWQTAYRYYNRLVDEHGQSSWTNLGRDRIIWLTSQGLAGEE